MRLYVISLARATERRAAIAEQLARLGVCYLIVDAVDASAMDEEALRAVVDERVEFRNLGRRLSTQEVACALSHREIYRRIVDGGGDGAVILEDDVTLAPEFVEVLRYFEAVGGDLAEQRELYHLGAMQRPFGRDLVMRLRSARAVSSRVRLARVLPRASGGIWGTFGYYITRAAAAAMLQQGKIMSVADDWPKCLRTGSLQRLWIAVPDVVFHPPETDSGLARGRELQLAKRAALASEGVRARLLSRLGTAAMRRLKRHLLRPVLRRIL